MEQTLEQRCKVALECLPDARYRTMLARLFDELLARAAVPVVQPPEFQEVSWGVDSTMRPCTGMAVSEYAFREWAKANGIALVAPLARQEPKPDSVYPVQPSGSEALRTIGAAGPLGDPEVMEPFWCHEQSHDRPRCEAQCAECAEDGVPASDNAALIAAAETYADNYEGESIPAQDVRASIQNAFFAGSTWAGKACVALPAPSSTRKEVALLLNRLVLMAGAKARQQPDEPPEDRITDAEVDALETQILALASGVQAPCLTCSANHYCPEHNPAPAGAALPREPEPKGGA